LGGNHYFGDVPVGYAWLSLYTNGVLLYANAGAVGRPVTPHGEGGALAHLCQPSGELVGVKVGDYGASSRDLFHAARFAFFSPPDFIASSICRLLILRSIHLA
jgi:hypothetical protein